MHIYRSSPATGAVEVAVVRSRADGNKIIMAGAYSGSEIAGALAVRAGGLDWPSWRATHEKAGLGTGVRGDTAQWERGRGRRDAHSLGMHAPVLPAPEPEEKRAGEWIGLGSGQTNATDADARHCRRSGGGVRRRRSPPLRACVCAPLPRAHAACGMRQPRRGPRSPRND